MRDLEIPAPADRSRRYRATEALPGCVTWLVLALPVALVPVLPPGGFVLAGVALVAAAAVAVVASNVAALRGYRSMRRHLVLPWARLLTDLDDPAAAAGPGDPGWHRAHLARRRTGPPPRERAADVVHAVIIATWTESRHVLEPTVHAVRAAAYDPARVILVVAYEARGGAEAERRAQRLVDDHRGDFGHVMAVRHDDRPGEFPGKGANITSAGRALAAHVEAVGIDPGRVVVTTLDADTRPHPCYLAALTYAWCTVPDPRQLSFQPIALYVSNAWDVPAPCRVVAATSSLWNVVLSRRPRLIRNFSAHAQGLAALVAMDFWSVHTVVEDGHHFWRSWFHFDGRYRVHPLPVPIYQDAVLSVSLVRTLRAQFVQLRRWAWGASDVAYVIDKGWCTPNTVPRRDLAAKLARLLVGHVMWATGAAAVHRGPGARRRPPDRAGGSAGDACGGCRAQGGGARRARPRHRREPPPATAPPCSTSPPAVVVDGAPVDPAAGHRPGVQRRLRPDLAEPARGRPLPRAVRRDREGGRHRVGRPGRRRANVTPAPTDGRHGRGGGPRGLTRSGW